MTQPRPEQPTFIQEMRDRTLKRHIKEIELIKKDIEFDSGNGLTCTKVDTCIFVAQHFERLGFEIKGFLNHMTGRFDGTINW